MSKNDFPAAPDLQGDFSQSHNGEIDNARPDNTPDPVELLDHHDLSSLDYTPGGTVEQDVHRQLSEAGRAAYREATRSVDERDHDEHYQEQLDSAFGRAVNRQARDDDRREILEEAGDDRAAARRALREQIDRELDSPSDAFNHAGRDIEHDLDR